MSKGFTPIEISFDDIHVNPYFECLMNQVFNAKALKEAVITLGKNRTFNFDPVYTQLTAWCFNSEVEKQSLGKKLKKFIGYGLHTKMFLVCLFMSLNAVKRSYI
jgi:hypothetical protein